MTKNEVRMIYELNDKLDYNELIKSQKNTKPVIEDIIGLFLEGDKLANAMDFIAFLRENNMNPRWASANSWRVTAKNKPVCRIDLGGLPHKWMNHFTIGDWQISELDSVEQKYLAAFVGNETMQPFVWENVMMCRRCSKCGPRTRTYAGKLFEQCCGLRVLNPDAPALIKAKELVLENKRWLVENL